MRVDTPADAFACLAVLVIGADKVGTFEERRFLYERLSGNGVFEDVSEEAFATLVKETTDRVCDLLPTEQGRVTDEGVSEAVGMIAGVLTTELRREAFRMAVELARVDGMAPSEETLLGLVRDGLDLDPATAAELMAPPRQA